MTEEQNLAFSQWLLSRLWWRDEFATIMMALPDPNPQQGWFELWREIDRWFELTGTFYLWLIPNKHSLVGEVRALSPARVYFQSIGGVESYMYVEENGRHFDRFLLPVSQILRPEPESDQPVIVEKPRDPPLG